MNFYASNVLTCLSVKTSLLCPWPLTALCTVALFTSSRRKYQVRDLLLHPRPLMLFPTTFVTPNICLFLFPTLNTSSQAGHKVVTDRPQILCFSRLRWWVVKVPRQGSGWKAAADLLGGRHHLQRLELAARFGEIGTTRGRSTLEWWPQAACFILAVALKRDVLVFDRSWLVVQAGRGFRRWETGWGAAVTGSWGQNWEFEGVPGEECSGASRPPPSSTTREPPSTTTCSRRAARWPARLGVCETQSCLLQSSFQVLSARSFLNFGRSGLSSFPLMNKLIYSVKTFLASSTDWLWTLLFWMLHVMYWSWNVQRVGLKNVTAPCAFSAAPATDNRLQNVKSAAVAFYHFSLFDKQLPCIGPWTPLIASQTLTKLPCDTKVTHEYVKGAAR